VSNLTEVKVFCGDSCTTEVNDFQKDDFLKLLAKLGKESGKSKLLFRGVRKQDFLDIYNSSCRKDLFKKVFLVGVKSSRHQKNRIKSESNIVEQILKSECNEEKGKLVFLLLRDLLKETFCKLLLEKDEKEFVEYFSKDNLENFVNGFSKLSNKECSEVCFYYLSFVHMIEDEILEGHNVLSSNIVSTSTSIDVSKTFSNEDGIILYLCNKVDLDHTLNDFTKKSYVGKVAQCKKLPTLNSQSDFMGEEEAGFREVLCPQHILAVEFLGENKMYINPYLTINFNKARDEILNFGRMLYKQNDREFVNCLRSMIYDRYTSFFEDETVITTDDPEV
jgi:hypothetical protein